MEEYESRHTGPVIDDAVDRAKEGGAIDKAVNAKPNPNLLDNWCFGNPVNQRGYVSETVTNGAYTIDRWKVMNNGRIALQDGYITLTGSASYGVVMRQYLEFLPSGVNVTFSVLTSEGLATATCKSNSHGIVGIKTKVTLQFYGDDGNYPYLSVVVPNGLGAEVSIDLYAVKLELGTQQTLAHQDENGNWVLNDIPAYGEQLRRCQRYFRRFPAWYCVGSQQAGNAIFRYPLNPPMRAVPTIAMQYPGDLAAALNNGSGNITPSSVTLDWNNSCDAIGFFFRGATGDAFTCTRYVDVNADL